MKVLAFNGSPRKTWNTATLLKKALEGAASQGAETEFIQLNELNMKGCQSCFSCKKRGGKSYGKCALKDDMTPLYGKIEHADAFFVGSPIYFGAVTSELKMFIDIIVCIEPVNQIKPFCIPVDVFLSKRSQVTRIKKWRSH